MSTSTRLLAATSLVLTAVLSAVSVLLQPEFTADPAERLAAIDEAGTSATISLLAFVLAQLPFMVAAVAIALLARAAAPRLSATGGALGVLGGFGHAVFGGVGLAYLAMATEVDVRAAFAETVTAIEAGPAVVFMACGMLGTVIGLVVLGIALFRSRVVPRWIPLCLWAFLAVEFVLTNVTAWASPAAALLYLAALSGIAVRVVHADTAAAAGHEPVPTASVAG
jgi:hypothetical protein